MLPPSSPPEDQLGQLPSCLLEAAASVPAGSTPAGPSCLSRRGRHYPLHRLLHRPHPQPAHTACLPAQRDDLSALVRGPRRRLAQGDQAHHRGGLYRAAPEKPRQTHGQAAPGHHPHALRLAGDRPGHSQQPRPRCPRAEACRQQGENPDPVCRGNQGRSLRASRATPW